MITFFFTSILVRFDLLLFDHGESRGGIQERAKPAVLGRQKVREGKE
jgi:hypothetical protein